MKEWKKQKKVHAEIDKYSPTEIGFATFFLNRTNRSGILKGGVIGGKNQTGNYKIDARFNKKDLLHRISRIAMYKGRISVLSSKLTTPDNPRLGGFGFQVLQRESDLLRGFHFLPNFQH